MAVLGAASYRCLATAGYSWLQLATAGYSWLTTHNYMCLATAGYSWLTTHNYMCLATAGSQHTITCWLLPCSPDFSHKITLLVSQFNPVQSHLWLRLWSSFDDWSFVHNFSVAPVCCLSCPTLILVLLVLSNFNFSVAPVCCLSCPTLIL